MVTLFQHPEPLAGEMENEAVIVQDLRVAFSYMSYMVARRRVRPVQIALWAYWAASDFLLEGTVDGIAPPPLFCCGRRGTEFHACG